MVKLAGTVWISVISLNINCLKGKSLKSNQAHGWRMIGHLATSFSVNRSKKRLIAYMAGFD